jgi:group I intron endonuclease
MAIVYHLFNVATGNGYVGKTVFTLEKRWASHLKEARCGSRYAIHRAIRKYGAGAFVRSVLVTCLPDEQDSAERAFIAELGTLGRHGYNMTAGGEGPKGLRHSDETKQRLRELALVMPDEQRAVANRNLTAQGWNRGTGKTRTAACEACGTAFTVRASRKDKYCSQQCYHSVPHPEAICAMARATKGKARPEAVRAKISASHRGLRASAETLAKMSAARKGVPWTPARRAACK